MSAGTADRRFDEAPPDLLSVVPEFAWAALRTGQESLLATHSVLRAFDGLGSGRLERTFALRAVISGRGVANRQARRLLDDVVGRLGELDPSGHIRLVGWSKAAEFWDVARIGRPHLIPLEHFQMGKAELRAALLATVYRTDDGGSPLTRRRIEEMTGISGATQRRYENLYGHARIVAPVFVELGHVIAPMRQPIAAEYGKWGFHIGRHGALMRRHGDIRKTTDHQPGSGRVAARANRKLANSDSPVMKTRGQQSLRAYFRTGGSSGMSAVKAWEKSRNALGKEASRATAFDSVLGYSAIESVSRSGRRLWKSVRDPPS